MADQLRPLVGSAAVHRNPEQRGPSFRSSERSANLKPHPQNTMTSTETPTITQVSELLAQHGYYVAATADALQVRDVETGITFRAVLQGNILYMTVTLTTLPSAAVTPEMMHKMLDAGNGISTSAFQLYDAGQGHSAITLNNFCTLQDMGPEDHDDILSLASYLMADLVAARDLLEPPAAS